MQTIYVQFADATEKEVVACFASAQDPDSHANLGEIGADDARYAAYYNSVPEPIRKYLITPVIGE